MSFREIAMLGTEQAPSAPETGTPADALVAQVEGSREWRTLLLAGAWAAIERGASNPRKAPAPLPPADADPRPLIPATIEGTLAGLLRDEVWLSALEIVEASGRRLPDPWWVEVLQRPRTAEEHEKVGRMAGPRARWLAALNPGKWAWAARPTASATETTEDLTLAWNEGEIHHRVDALREVRRRSPELGRAWLEADLANEPAKNRERLLRPLLDEPDPGDAALLMGLRQDRSRAVTALVATALCRQRVPELRAERIARAATLLQMKKAGGGGWIKQMFVGRSKLEITLNPPQRYDDSWAAEGVEKKARRDLSGPASWAVGLIALCPPSHWSDAQNLSPPELLDGVAEWPILLALSEATENHADAEWAEALLMRWPVLLNSELSDEGRVRGIEIAPRLLELIPESRRPDIVERVAGLAPHWPDLWLEMLQITPWDDAVTRILARGVHEAMGRARYEHRWREMLVEASVRAEPALIEPTLNGIVRPTPAWSTAIERARSLIRLRKALTSEERP